jgi:hypothetical protein
VEVIPLLDTHPLFPLDSKCPIMKSITSTFLNILSAFQSFYRILTVINRREELLRLRGWAKRKQLTHQHQFYQRCLEDEEIRIVRYGVTHRHLTMLAQWVSWFSHTVFPTPRYLKRGSAAIYSRKRLTYKPKQSYSYL